MNQGEKTDNNQGWLKVIVASIFQAILNFIRPPKLKSLKGEIAVIIGASRGVGRELAIKLAEQGTVPVCLDINHIDNQTLVKDIRKMGHEAFGYTCDVTSKDQVEHVIDAIDRDVGDISMYFHCCGVPSPRSLVSEPPPIQVTMDVSIVSHFYLLDQILPKMKKLKYGHIVLLTSVAGLSCIKTQLPLAVAQFAVQGLFESLVEDLRMSKCQDLIQISLIHIYPFIVSENLENDIRLRIPSYFGTIRAEHAALQILRGVRRNQMEISIPTYYFYIGNILRMLPKNATYLLREMLDTGVDFG
ncbi:17-beta-hydroxysteroid dehydrogenase 13-like isoform X2 [Culicoides brevitarsis]|uniref:17-beta-hydroxysteroid dehydrogenase 13-like isoform X2 n=1 Tax=Culicoides brevitarsis TaxID=469753 RepID=UPI00307BD503